MKKHKTLKIAVVIIVVIVLFYFYYEKRKTDQLPVNLPYPNKTGDAGGGNRLPAGPPPFNPPVGPPTPRHINTELNPPIIPFKL